MDECNTQEELLSVKFIGGGEAEEVIPADVLPSCGERKFYCNFPQQSALISEPEDTDYCHH